MNFYKHHIGDYASATEHLTWDEDQAYTRLLRVYYRDERPLPLEFPKVLRLARAQSSAQKAAVQTVLDEFFVKGADGWRNKRADVEIAQASNQAETNRRIAEQREHARRARIDHEASNGSSNGSSTNRSPETIGGREPIQTPDSTIQTPAREGNGLNGHAHPVKSKRKSGRVPQDFTPDVSFALAELPDLDAEREVAKFRGWEFKTPRSDWASVWRNWIQSARESGKYAKRAEARIQWR